MSSNFISFEQHISTPKNHEYHAIHNASDGGGNRTVEFLHHMIVKNHYKKTKAFNNVYKKEGDHYTNKKTGDKFHYMKEKEDGVTNHYFRHIGKVSIVPKKPAITTVAGWTKHMEDKPENKSKVNESYTIKSVAHGKVHLMKNGKKIKEFDNPQDANFHISKLNRLNELSSGLLDRYKEKASRSAAWSDASRRDPKNSLRSKDIAQKTFRKRMVGLARANNKEDEK